MRSNGNESDQQSKHDTCKLQSRWLSCILRCCCWGCQIAFTWYVRVHIRHRYSYIHIITHLVDSITISSCYSVYVMYFRCALPFASLDIVMPTNYPSHRVKVDAAMQIKLPHAHNCCAHRHPIIITVIITNFVVVKIYAWINNWRPIDLFRWTLITNKQISFMWTMWTMSLAIFNYNYIRSQLGTRSQSNALFNSKWIPF